MSRTRNVILAAIAGSLIAATPSIAQQMGRDGYSFPTRNPSLAAQFNFQQRMQQEAANGGGAGGGSLGALNQFVTTYSSSSTAIGNMNTVNQTLSGGSNGTVDQTTDQDSTGNQGSESTATVTIDDSITKTTTITPPATPPAD